ncbi:hypothetical protein BC629DRAFT_884279 [Irpex lacteus]|nr:hypothetical protein BC629DRAFT_884279 [Irpex lacteus]
MHHTTLLAKLGAFRHLTNLIIYTVKLSELENLDTVLCSLAPTLCSCAIMICLRFSEVPFDLDQYVRCLHNGLNACLLLRTFTLRICSKVPHQPKYPPSLLNQIVESTAREWRFALELLSLLPNPDQLKRVGFTYSLDEIINPDVRFGYDRLPWPLVRDTFRRFRNVERISVAFYANDHDYLIDIEGKAANECTALRKEWRNVLCRS